MTNTPPLPPSSHVSPEQSSKKTNHWVKGIFITYILFACLMFAIHFLAHHSAEKPLPNYNPVGEIQK